MTRAVNSETAIARAREIASNVILPQASNPFVQ
jgi:hypothetical protein